MNDPKRETLRILPMPDTEPPSPFERIATALERIEKGKNLST